MNIFHPDFKITQMLNFILIVMNRFNFEEKSFFRINSELWNTWFIFT